MIKPFNKPFKEKGAKRVKVMWESEEAEKHMALWTGIFFFMTLIVFLWAVNIRGLFEYYNMKKGSKLNIDELSSEFNQAWNQFKKNASDMNIQEKK